jgi:hypothetical protein
VPTPLPPTTLAEALDRIRIGRPDQVYFVIGPLLKGPPVERIVLGARVDVRRARTGEIIDSISIIHEPSECDQVTAWTETTRSGDPVGYAEIAGRIRAMLE